jgi:hypothetical protein
MPMRLEIETDPPTWVTEWTFERTSPERDDEGFAVGPGPGVSRLEVEQQLAGKMAGWTARAEFVLHEKGGPRPWSRIELSGVRFVPPAGSAGWFDVPTQNGLRAVHLGDLQDRIRDFMEATNTRLAAKTWLDAIARGRRPGRRGTTLRMYALWAERRVEAERQAPRRGVIEWMAEQYGETPGAIKAFVHKARDKGLLEGNPPRLTDLARDVLTFDEEA